MEGHKANQCSPTTSDPNSFAGRTASRRNNVPTSIDPNWTPSWQPACCTNDEKPNAIEKIKNAKSKKQAPFSPSTEKLPFFNKHPDNGCFSNFHQPGSPILIDGEKYICVEQYLMATKAKMTGNDEQREAIMKEENSVDIKRRGDRIHWPSGREHWENAACDLLWIGNKAKYEQDSSLRARLFNTYGCRLVETDTGVTIWNAGISYTDNAKLQNEDTWNGLNWFGDLLTLLRQHLMMDVRFQNEASKIMNSALQLDIESRVRSNSFGSSKRKSVEDLSGLTTKHGKPND
jgi:ribA/ribD-fused uncharacterized protein